MDNLFLNREIFKTKKFLTAFWFLIAVTTFGLAQPVSAQINVDIQGGLKPIVIPTFLSLDQIQHFSIYSYIALVVSMIFVLLSIYWTFVIIRNAVKIVQSEGDEGKIKDATQSIQAIFIGIAMMIGFFVVLFVVGSFFGLGSVFSWPKKLSICADGKLYITLALEMQSDPSRVVPETEIDAACFNN